MQFENNKNRNTQDLVSSNQSRKQQSISTQINFDINHFSNFHHDKVERYFYNKTCLRTS